MAYAMTFSPVLLALSALSNGHAMPGRLENVAVLAEWSKSYLAQAFHLTKVIGLLKTTPPSGPIGPREDEDLLLAEGGLDSYAEALPEDDRP